MLILVRLGDSWLTPVVPEEYSFFHSCKCPGLAKKKKRKKKISYGCSGKNTIVIKSYHPWSQKGRPSTKGRTHRGAHFRGLAIWGHLVLLFFCLPLEFVNSFTVNFQGQGQKYQSSPRHLNIWIKGQEMLLRFFFGPFLSTKWLRRCDKCSLKLLKPLTYLLLKYLDEEFLGYCLS